MQNPPPPIPANPTVEKKERKRRRRRSGPLKKLQRWLQRQPLRRYYLRIGLGVFAVLIALSVVGVIIAIDAIARVQSAVGQVQQVFTQTNNRAGASLTLEDFNDLGASVRNLVNTLEDVERQSRFVRPFRWIRPEVDAVLVYQDATLQLASAASKMINGIQPSVFFLGGGENSATVTTQISSGERLVELLRLGRPLFEEAGENLDTAALLLNELDVTRLNAEFLLQFETLVGYQGQLQEIQGVLVITPELLTATFGLEAPQTYLVLSQNNDELRPSGGFISTYGWLTLQNGRIADYEYNASTPTSPNPPRLSSAEIAQFVQPPMWWLQYRQAAVAAWDGSWTPNFPETAERAMWYYNSGDNPHVPVQGVIAIDIEAFERILAALGSVRVVEGGRDEVVTAQNFRSVVYEIREGSGDTPHKEFLAATFRQIFADWQQLTDDPARSEAIFNALLQALLEKHVMLYFADPELNQALDLLGWSGRQASPGAIDYLMVVDANLGNKSNSSVTRTVTYDVQIEEDRSLSNRLTLNYDYPANAAELDPAVDARYHGPLTYRNLLQVFTPPGIELGETTPNFSNLGVFNHGDHDLFTTILTVPYDTSQRYQVSYTLPQMVEINGTYETYRLLIEKQPGTRSDSVIVQVALPPGMRVVRVSPQTSAQFNVQRPILEFRVDLTTDTLIEIVYEPIPPDA